VAGWREVRICFDINILVAGLLVDHGRHQVCRSWLDRAKNNEFQPLLSVHSLAEAYSVLTRLPVPHRLSPQTVERILHENLHSFERIALSASDYETVLADVVRLGITSGGIFDALIGRAAIVGRADRLLTFNVRDFERLGDEVRHLIQVPGA
jgi:predicted nucleic acid-binding protein